MYNIEAINTMQTVANYCTEAVEEYEQGLGDGIEKYTARWEAEFADTLENCSADDIGGLIVYLRGNKEVAVYDYENFCGWIL
jgi:hypothetical protein